jgi:hypothetical protein
MAQAKVIAALRAPGRSPANILGEAFMEALKTVVREVVREEIRAFAGQTGPNKPREWLKAEELAVEFGLPKTWFEERGRAGEIERTKPRPLCIIQTARCRSFFGKEQKRA